MTPLSAERGVTFEIARWDDPDLASRGYDALLVRSTWDYTDRVAQFIAALEALEGQGQRVFNASAVIRWNAQKTYLEDLAQKGAPTIPTIWTPLATADVVARAFETFEAAEIVVKPQVGAGSRNTIRLRRNAWSAADLIDAPQAPAMIQPFLHAIETTGETSLFFFGGRLAHTISKLPASGKWYANVDGARFVRGVATPAQVAVAEAVIALAPPGLLYARVDLVDGADGRPRLIELEAIEPYLFFAFAPEGAAFLVDALRDAVG